MEEQRVDESALIAGVRLAGRGGSGTGVDHHAGGFIDDGEMFVLVEYLERDIFWRGVEWWRLG